MFPRFGISRIESCALTGATFDEQSRGGIFFGLFELALQLQTLTKSEKTSAERDIVTLPGSENLTACMSHESLSLGMRRNARGTQTGKRRRSMRVGTNRYIILSGGGEGTG
jgi:hypothetical protein